MANRPSVLVTGATGRQGGAVARELLAAEYPVRAMTRKPDSPAARALAGLGAQVVRGDLDDASSLEQALDDVWGVFAVQNTWEAGVEREERQGKAMAHAARRAGVQHYVYSSVGSAHRGTGIPHFENKWRIEETVRDLGFPSHVVLRPVFFMENWLSPWFRPGIDAGALRIALAPATVLQMIAVADIGRYGRWAFDAHRALNGRAIDIAGDAHTMPETAALIGAAAGRPIAFVRLSIEDVRAASADFATMLEWLDQVGYDADIAARSAESGIRPTSFAEWAAGASWR